VWVGGVTGLSRFDGLRFVHYPEPQDELLPSTDISALAASPDGGLWIGFQFGGVAFVRNGRVTRYGEREGVPRGAIFGFFWEHDGTLGISAGSGLAHLHGTRWERFASESITTSEGALVDRAGTLWVARTDDRMLARTAHEDHFREMAKRSGHLQGYAPFAMSPDGTVWAWTNDGLTRLDSSTDPRPSGNRTFGGGAGDLPMMFDRDGNLWLWKDPGHRLASQEWLSDPTLPHIKYVPLGPDDNVSSLFEDREGNVWAGTKIGLDRFSHSNIVRVPLPRCLWRYAIAAGDAGTLWAACPSSPSNREVGFVLEMRNGTVVHRQDTAGFTADYRDPDGTVWFAGDEGLGRIESGRVVMTPWPEEVTKSAQAVVRDRTGAFWVSIAGAGVFRVSKGVWSPYGALAALPHLPAIVATADTAGAVWFGYTDNRIAL
jgi:ligand-binding sensor domain-containing protein